MLPKRLEDGGTGMSETGDGDRRSGDDASGHDGVPVLDSADLFRGGRQAVILHRNDRYVLRITRQDKLILNK